MFRGEIDKKAAYFQARSFMAGNLENNGKECQAEGEAKSGRMKSSIWRTHENSEESILIEPEHREFKETMRLQEKSWKHQWLQPCFARHARKASMGRSAARPMISSLNVRVSWKAVDPQECVWRKCLPKCHEDHTAGKGDNSLQHYNLVHKFFLCLKS